MPATGGSVLPSFAASATPFLRHRRRRLHPVTDQIQAREGRAFPRGKRMPGYWGWVGAGPGLDLWRVRPLAG
jgi:hypothetical protein